MRGRNWVVVARVTTACANTPAPATAPADSVPAADVAAADTATLGDGAGAAGLAKHGYRWVISAVVEIM